MFGACRVVKKGDFYGAPAVLVSPTSYIGQEYPELDDDRITQLLKIRYSPWMQNVIAFKPTYAGKEFLAWISHPPPSDYEFLGAIQTTESDTDHDSKVLGEWDFEEMVFLQMLYETDKQLFEKIFQETKEQTRKDMERSSANWRAKYKFKSLNSLSEAHPLSGFAHDALGEVIDLHLLQLTNSIKRIAEEGGTQAEQLAAVERTITRLNHVHETAKIDTYYRDEIAIYLESLGSLVKLSKEFENLLDKMSAW